MNSKSSGSNLAFIKLNFDFLITFWTLFLMLDIKTHYSVALATFNHPIVWLWQLDFTIQCTCKNQLKWPDFKNEFSSAFSSNSKKSSESLGCTLKPDSPAPLLNCSNFLTDFKLFQDFQDLREIPKFPRNSEFFEIFRVFREILRYQRNS